MKHLLKKFLLKFVKKTVLPRGGKTYLIRYTIFSCKWFSIKLHKTFMSDPADMHDHPWAYISIMLKGGYVEWTRKDICIDTHNEFYMSSKEIGTWYGPGSVLIRKAHLPHRLEIPEGKMAITLIITSHKHRRWGFHTSKGWVPFDKSSDLLTKQGY